MTTPNSKKLLLILTKECNRQCPFCIDAPNRQYYPENTPQFMPLTTVEKVLNFATAHQIATIALNGGEPTLHPQIIEIAQMIKDRGFILKLFTNYDHPKIVKQLDGLADIFRISYYGQKNLPKQSDFQSKLTLKIMLMKNTFPQLEQLVDFIQKQRPHFSDLKIHTPMQNNAYSISQQVDYLPQLEQLFPLKRNDKGDYYHEFMGLQIEREDLPNTDYQLKQRLYKAHLDGTISHYFEEDHHQLSHLPPDAFLTKALRAHRNPQYRQNVWQAHQTHQLDMTNLNQYLPPLSR